MPLHDLPPRLATDPKILTNLLRLNHQRASNTGVSK